MHIKRTRVYQSELLAILKYIAKDKPSASLNFKQELKKHISDIPTFNKNKP